MVLQYVVHLLHQITTAMKKQSIESIRNQAEKIVTFAEFQTMTGVLGQRVASAHLQVNGFYACMYGEVGGKQIKLFVTK
jgi:hypothetical protein